MLVKRHVQTSSTLAWQVSVAELIFDPVFARTDASELDIFFPPVACFWSVQLSISRLAVPLFRLFTVELLEVNRSISPEAFQTETPGTAAEEADLHDRRFQAVPSTGRRRSHVSFSVFGEGTPLVGSAILEGLLHAVTGV